MTAISVANGQSRPPSLLGTMLLRTHTLDHASCSSPSVPGSALANMPNNASATSRSIDLILGGIELNTNVGRA